MSSLSVLTPEFRGLTLTRRRQLARLLLCCAVLLVPWIGFLAFEQGDGLLVRQFGASWVGLDVAEICGLLLTARALTSAAPTTSMRAAASATLFAVDAWFDCMSAPPHLDYAIALTMAFAAELPLAILLAFISITTARDQPAGSRCTASSS